jgi:hypothetical protein
MARFGKIMLARMMLRHERRILAAYAHVYAE